MHTFIVLLAVLFSCEQYLAFASDKKSALADSQCRKLDGRVGDFLQASLRQRKPVALIGKGSCEGV